MGWLHLLWGGYTYYGRLQEVAWGGYTYYGRLQERAVLVLRADLDVVEHASVEVVPGEGEGQGCGERTLTPTSVAVHATLELVPRRRLEGRRRRHAAVQDELGRDGHAVLLLAGLGHFLEQHDAGDRARARAHGAGAERARRLGRDLLQVGVPARGRRRARRRGGARSPHMTAAALPDRGGDDGRAWRGRRRTTLRSSFLRARRSEPMRCWVASQRSRRHGAPLGGRCEGHLGAAPPMRRARTQPTSDRLCTASSTISRQTQDLCPGVYPRTPKPCSHAHNYDGPWPAHAALPVPRAQEWTHAWIELAGLRSGRYPHSRRAREGDPKT